MPRDNPAVGPGPWGRDGSRASPDEEDMLPASLHPVWVSRHLLAPHLRVISSRVLLGPGASSVRSNRRKGWVSCCKRLRRGRTASPGLPSWHSTCSRSSSSSVDGPPTRDRISSSGVPSWLWVLEVSTVEAQTHQGEGNGYKEDSYKLVKLKTGMVQKIMLKCSPHAEEAYSFFGFWHFCFCFV